MSGKKLLTLHQKQNTKQCYTQASNIILTLNYIEIVSYVLQLKQNYAVVGVYYLLYIINYKHIIIN